MQLLNKQSETSTSYGRAQCLRAFCIAASSQNQGCLSKLQHQHHPWRGAFLLRTEAASKAPVWAPRSWWARPTLVRVGCCDCRVKSTQKVLPRAGAAGGRWKYHWQLLQQICSSVPVPCWAWGGCFPSKPLAWLMWVWRSSVSQGGYVHLQSCRTAARLLGGVLGTWPRTAFRGYKGHKEHG